MAEEVITPAVAPATAPVATPAPATPPAATPTAKAAARPPVAPGEEPWKGERAKREARQYLKAFGIKVKGKDDVASVAAEYRDKQTKRKAELTDLRKKLPDLEAQVTASKTILKVYADQALSKLPETVQAHIRTMAGDDPIKVLEQVSLTSTLTAAAIPVAPETKAAPTKAPIPPGASTTTAGGAPTPASPTSPVNHKEVFARLKTENPVLAAQYAKRHNREIFDTPT